MFFKIQTDEERKIHVCYGNVYAIAGAESAESLCVFLLFFNVYLNRVVITDG